MKDTTISVDVAKSVFEVAVSDRPGQVRSRSTLCHAKTSPAPDRLRAWALERERARGHNKAAVALANKIAGVVWSVDDGSFGPTRGKADNYVGS